MIHVRIKLVIDDVDYFRRKYRIALLLCLLKTRGKIL